MTQWDSSSPNSIQIFPFKLSKGSKHKKKTIMDRIVTKDTFRAAYHLSQGNRSFNSAYDSNGEKKAFLLDEKCPPQYSVLSHP